MDAMQFPIRIVFKLFTLAPQIYVTDGTGALIGYARQKLFRLKESVTIFADEAQSQPIYQIDADRVIDFSANYALKDAHGRVLGAVRRHGMRSLWRAHYEIVTASGRAFEVREESGWVRLVDSLVGEIPVIGMLTGYFLNPTYIVSRQDGGEILRMIKQRSFLESEFTIEQHASMDGDEQQVAMLGLTMIVLLERSRG